MAQHPLRRRRAEPPAGECPRVVTASACGHGPGLRLRAARCPQGEEQAAGCESAVGGRGAAPRRSPRGDDWVLGHTHAVGVAQRQVELRAPVPRVRRARVPATPPSVISPPRRPPLARTAGLPRAAARRRAQARGAHQYTAAAWSRGTPRPREYATPAAKAASTCPCAAASAYHSAAMNLSCPTPCPCSYSTPSRNCASASPAAAPCEYQYTAMVALGLSPHIPRACAIPSTHIACAAPRLPSLARCRGRQGSSGKAESIRAPRASVGRDLRVPLLSCLLQHLQAARALRIIARRSQPRAISAGPRPRTASGRCCRAKSPPRSLPGLLRATPARKPTH